ncbi:RNA methyltransferase [uncultured Olegusella sp.]|uniref:TrmH family RNA methyltransferase n=1 Tax=uncultured Olegusella sp. TaxID=1979846 RepID=UPI002614DD69|nr:RNA methyltransferase [uncultured Olegusella sp.]
MQRIDISHLDDPRLAAYLSLSGRQLKHVLNPKAAVMIAESRLVIEVALKEGFSPRSLFIDERRFESCADIFAQLDNDIPVFVAPTELMSKVVGYTVTRGILGCFSRPKPRDTQEVLAGAKRIAVLEDIVDVSNVGAIFRSAAALGADAVLLAPTCADPLNRRSLRVSMGTVLQVPWAYLPAPWPQQCLGLLHKEGFFCAALALDEHALRLDDPALVQHEKLALFLGTEGSGLAPEVLAGCDTSVIIPMSHGVDSLNVAAASAVAFWQLCQKE